jgi:hypothetical protein
MSAFPVLYGADGLMQYCDDYLQRTRSPKSARDVVDNWYRKWRGKEGKPQGMTKKRKVHHTDRVAKWFERQAARGLVTLVDTKGRWGSKRYRRVEMSRNEWAGRKRLRKTPMPETENLNASNGL